MTNRWLVDSPCDSPYAKVFKRIARECSLFMETNETHHSMLQLMEKYPKWMASFDSEEDRKHKPEIQELIKQSYDEWSVHRRTVLKI